MIKNQRDKKTQQNKTIFVNTQVKILEVQDNFLLTKSLAYLLAYLF
jgi:hypothetical protein